MIARGPAVRHHARYLAVIAAMVALGVISTLTLLNQQSSADSTSGQSARNEAGTSHAARPGHPTATAYGSRTPASAPASSVAASSAPNSLSPAEAKTSIEKIIDSAPAGGVSVAALNTRTGAQYAAGASGGMWTASAYKLFMVEALLVQHQDSGTTLSTGEDYVASTAIENSDNNSGYSLFLTVGGRSGEDAMLKRFGMTHSHSGASDPAFTTLSGTDGLILLRNLVEKKSPLDAKSRAYLLDLMRNVEPDQRWGVGVVADPGTSFANKNGWLAVDNSNAGGEDDNGLWITTSLGIVTVHGQQVLLSVLTRHNSDLDEGIKRVESLSRDLAAIVAP